MEPNYISNEEKDICQQLLKLDQGHLIASLSSFSEVQRKEFVHQVNQLNKTYPGGIETYINRAKKLLIDSANDVNPYEGYVPSVPKGLNLDFYNEKEIHELEALGIQELQHACFVLVAGGLGERLGFNGIKVSISIEQLTRQCFLQYYIQYILAFQKKSGAKSPIPLAIMVSDDTHDLTVQLLKDNHNFGMPEGQITIMKQEKVPALLDNLAHFSQKPNSLLIDTKPHGHGDVHTLLYMTGLAKKWADEGRKWICLFQDTNPLVFRSYPAVLGVSKKYNYEVNSIAIPRKPGENVGAICFLKNEKLNKNLTINVEYNQLDSLLKTFGGEPKDANGYSLYPGNTNGLIFSLVDYLPVLLSTQGLISEFINPKYTDHTKTMFKSATRLECMMQDYPKLLKSGERVGFTQIDRKFCFSTVKNDLKTAAQKVKGNLPPESASVCEQEFYWLNREILKICGVEFEEDKVPVVKSFAGIPVPEATRVVLLPEFGVTLAEIQKKIKGKNFIHKNSNLVLEGDVRLENLKLDGSVRVVKDLVNVEINNKIRYVYQEVNMEDPKVLDTLKIRGYDLLPEGDKSMELI